MHDSVFGPILAALLGEYIRLCLNCQNVLGEPVTKCTKLHYPEQIHVKANSIAGVAIIEVSTNSSTLHTVQQLKAYRDKEPSHKV